MDGLKKAEKVKILLPKVFKQKKNKNVNENFKIKTSKSILWNLNSFSGFKHNEVMCHICYNIKCKSLFVCLYVRS